VIKIISQGIDYPEIGGYFLIDTDFKGIFLFGFWVLKYFGEKLENIIVAYK
jgi:hypothetical protein